MYRAALEGILGFTKRGNRLTIEPCVPAAWREFTIDYRYGSTTYAITVRNPNDVSVGVVRIEVDGQVVADRVVNLSDDGRRREVVVTMGSDGEAA
jgi:cyclic beta-1,2-glucan synthetase